MKSICRVAPLAGSVDRNKYVLNSDSLAQFVAPLAGSVDRNANLSDFATVPQLVAPLAGSVDRNVVPLLELRAASPSLPSRGAWIEILAVLASAGFGYKSLPSRGAWIEIGYRTVSYNKTVRSLPSRGAWIEIPPGSCPPGFYQSLPSRGAWIEIIRPEMPLFSLSVAPLAGSVDRNTLWQRTHRLSRRRSPRGERG